MSSRRQVNAAYGTISCIPEYGCQRIFSINDNRVQLLLYIICSAAALVIGQQILKLHTRFSTVLYYPVLISFRKKLGKPPKIKHLHIPFTVLNYTSTRDKGNFSLSASHLHATYYLHSWNWLTVTVNSQTCANNKQAVNYIYYRVETYVDNADGIWLPSPYLPPCHSLAYTQQSIVLKTFSRTFEDNWCFLLN